MRIKLLLDHATFPRKQSIEDALLKIRDDYTSATPVTWEYEMRDFSHLTWVDYLPGAQGISWDIVGTDTQAIFLQDGEKWDNVIYVIDPIHWLPQRFGGWSLGAPWHGYQVQLVKAFQNEWLYKAFAMEIAHGWNQVCIQEIGDNLLTTFGVRDFGNEVIHGVDPRYGKNVPPNAPMDGYFTDYNYRPMIEIAKEKLSRAYKTRSVRYAADAYLFRRNLYFGKTGDDVIELQKRFAREGLALYKPTGFFASKTKASAIAYQKKYNIVPQQGYIGEKTRAHLNNAAHVVPTPSSPRIDPEAIFVSELAMWDTP